MSVLEFFKCPVCTGLLKSPKSLPCGHNVCEKCLNIHIIRNVPMSGYEIEEYLKSGNVAVKPAKELFECPSKDCDKEIKPRDPTKRTWMWASQFENNLRLTSLMDMMRGGRQCSDNIAQCNVCMNTISDSPVTSVCLNCFQSLCSRCAMVHRHINPSHAFHKLTDLQTNLNQIASKTHDNSETRDSIYKKCPIFCKLHSASEVTHFCTDCSQHCCIRCSEVVHGSCRGVDQITFIYKSLVGRDEVTDLKTRFSACHAAVSNILTMSVIAKEQEEKVVSKKYQDFVGANGVTLGKISALLDSSFKTETSALKAIIVRCELAEEHLKVCKSRMMELDGDANAGRFTKTIIDMKKKCTRIEKEVGLLKNMTKEMKVTAADLEKKAKTADNSVAIVKASLKIACKIMMRLDDDENDCWLTDCCTTTNGLIIVTDHINCKLKWTNENGDVNGIDLPAAPWSIAVQEANTQGCLTLPETCTIQFFQIDNDMLTLTRDMKTAHQCYGAAFLGDNIVTSLRHDNQFMTICILSPNGATIKELSHDEGIFPPHVFSHARYLRVKEDQTNAKILVSDYMRHAVLGMKCFGLDDEKVETVMYTWNEDGDHAFPAGLTWDARGDILVCCNSVGTVRRISAAEGDHVSSCVLDGLPMPRSSCVLDGLPMPRSVACCKDKLALTVDSGKMKNYVVVFEEPLQH